MHRKEFGRRVTIVAFLVASCFMMGAFLPWGAALETMQDLTAALAETYYEANRSEEDIAMEHSRYLRSIAREGLQGVTTRLPVLAYHQVLSCQWYYPFNVANPWVLSERTFEGQMRYLYENGFVTINSEQLTGFLNHGESLPPNAVMITFDDGYLDNAVYAYPIMKKFGFTGIIFMITSIIEAEPSTVRAYPAQFMSFADMKRTSGVFEFGSHTHDMHHNVRGRPLLLAESVENIRTDLRLSFEHDFMSINAGFAYPFGRHSANAVSALRQEGVPFAFATHFGYVERGSDVFSVCRVSQ